MNDKELLKALGLKKKSCISEQIVQTTHHWLDACEKISELEQENAKLQAKIDDWQSEYIELENLKNNEIAELKKKYEKVCTIAHNRGSFSICAMRENRIFEEKLNKAKEVIKEFLSLGVFGIFKGTTAEEIIDKAEQFLKENE